MGKLPDFLIIGEMKCGTTALYKYATEHPQIEPATRKELSFFNDHFGNGIKWYKQQFPGSLHHLTGEASGYLKFPGIARKIANIMPDVKLIIILRNPADRAFSHYQMHLEKGKVTIPFEKAIERIPTYINQGKYAWKLQKWMEVFPRRQFHIIQSEMLYEHPQKTMNGLFRFLGLPSHTMKDYKKYNNRTYTKIPLNTKKRLLTYYKPYNKKLYRLLGKEFNWNQ